MIGVWSGASRRKVRMIEKNHPQASESGPWVQVSRLGNPLINEVVIPLGTKDTWNTLYPAGDSAFASHYEHPELAGLLPVLYPGVFPNLKGLTAARADLVAVLLTGIPPGIVPGFQNYTGKVMADQPRLNVAIPPTTSNPSIFGLLGGDAAGFPNGRRVFDDVVSIELRAIAGVTYALVNKSYTPDGAAGKLTEGLTPARTATSAFPIWEPARRLQHAVRADVHLTRCHELYDVVSITAGTRIRGLGDRRGRRRADRPSDRTMHGIEIEISPAERTNAQSQGGARKGRRR